jgi:hypothetical protein
MDATNTKETKEAQGVQVGGREPKALLLSDGTRLALEDEAGPGGRSDWTLIGDGDSDGGHDGPGISVRHAMRLAGDDHADYVRVRTRSEVEWLRVVAEWFEQQADRLDRDLASASARA